MSNIISPAFVLGKEKLRRPEYQGSLMLVLLSAGSYSIDSRSFLCYVQIRTS